jgi:hypothetical protein
MATIAEKWIEKGKEEAIREKSQTTNQNIVRCAHSSGCWGEKVEVEKLRR